MYANGQMGQLEVLAEIEGDKRRWLECNQGTVMFSWGLAVAFWPVHFRSSRILNLNLVFHIIVKAFFSREEIQQIIFDSFLS